MLCSQEDAWKALVMSPDIEPVMPAADGSAGSSTHPEPVSDMRDRRCAGRQRSSATLAAGLPTLMHALAAQPLEWFAGAPGPISSSSTRPLGALL